MSVSLTSLQVVKRRLIPEDALRQSGQVVAIQRPLASTRRQERRRAGTMLKVTYLSAIVPYQEAYEAICL